MTLKLNISERLYALVLLNQFKGNLETLVDALEDTKKFRISENEWEKADKKVNTVMDDKGEPATSWTWNDDKGGEKEIEITKLVEGYLVEKIEEANTKGELTFQDKAAITLSGKLSKKTKKE